MLQVDGLVAFGELQVSTLKRAGPAIAGERQRVAGKCAVQDRNGNIEGLIELLEEMHLIQGVVFLLRNEIFLGVNLVHDGNNLGNQAAGTLPVAAQWVGCSPVEGMGQLYLSGESLGASLAPFFAPFSAFSNRSSCDRYRCRSWGSLLRLRLRHVATLRRLHHFHAILVQVVELDDILAAARLVHIGNRVRELLVSAACLRGLRSSSEHWTFERQMWSLMWKRASSGFFLSQPNSKRSALPGTAILEPSPSLVKPNASP